MGMVAAKCTQCGANIEVDESKEAGICSHCGTAFITEKVINNYTIHNHNTVNNNIAHATINVKNGDDATDSVKRYRAFLKLGKYIEALKKINEMEEKYPDSGLTYYCIADFLLTARFYDQWRNAANDWLSRDDTGSILSDFEACNSIFDTDAMRRALDKFEAKSDDEICAKFDDLSELKVLDIDMSSNEKDYDDKAFRTLDSYWKAVNGASDPFEYYMGPINSALFCAKKYIRLSKDFMTDAEREQFADFIREVDEKCAEFEEIVKRRDEAKKRAIALGERICADNQRLVGKTEAATEKSSRGSGKSLKKILTAIVVIAVIAVAAVVIIKKFL